MCNNHHPVPRLRFSSSRLLEGIYAACDLNCGWFGSQTMCAVHFWILLMMLSPMIKLVLEARVLCAHKNREILKGSPCTAPCLIHAPDKPKRKSKSESRSSAPSARSYHSRPSVRQPEEMPPNHSTIAVAASAGTEHSNLLCFMKPS